MVVASRKKQIWSMTPFPKEPKYVLCEIFMLCPEEKNASSVLGLNFFSSTYILLHNRVITVSCSMFEFEPILEVNGKTSARGS